MDLHRALAQAVFQRLGGLDDEPLVEVTDAVAVERSEPEAVGDAVGLRGVGTGEPDHLKRGAAAERNDGSR